MDPEYPKLDGVTLKPGIRVFVTDRDHGNWDYYGTILTAYSVGRSWHFDVEFPPGGKDRTFNLDLDQIAPYDTDTDEAREWRAARQLKVFLCHGSEDKESARAMYDELRRANLIPWLDSVDILPGQEWDAAIRDAVRACHIILVFLSSRSVGKTGYVQKEIRFALDRADEQPEGATYIIPVKLEECPVPNSLSRWQWINLFETGGRERLLNHLRKLALERFGRS